MVMLRTLPRRLLTKPLPLCGSAKIADFTLELIPHQPRYEPPIPHLIPAIASTHACIAKDLDQIRALTKVLDNALGIEKNILLGNLTNSQKQSTASEKNRGDQVLSDDENGEQAMDTNLLNLEDRISKSSERELLDLFILYLCRVHSFCYYSAESYPNYDYMLVLGGPTRRGTKNNSLSEDGNSWAKELDNKIRQKMTKEKNSWRKEVTSEAATEKGVEDLYRDKIYRENDDRFDENCVQKCSKP